MMHKKVTLMIGFVVQGNKWLFNGIAVKNLSVVYKNQLYAHILSNV